MNSNFSSLTSTARARGAVGPNAIVPKRIAEIADKTVQILDFGAGKEAVHTKALREKGLNVFAWDVGENNVFGVHLPELNSLCFDIVFASNVINVHNNIWSLKSALSSMLFALKNGGLLVLNYPESPRKLPFSTEEMKLFLERSTAMSFYRVGGTKRAPIWKGIKR